MRIVGLTNKQFRLTIKWVVDAEVLLEEGTENTLESLREIGEAEITDIELEDKGKANA